MDERYKERIWVNFRSLDLQERSGVMISSCECLALRAAQFPKLCTHVCSLPSLL